MDTPAPGLRAPRRYRNASKQTAKLELAIPPGDELVVSDAVAEQLDAARVGLREADEATDAAADAAADAVAPAAEPVDDGLDELDKGALVELAGEHGVEVDKRKGEAKIREALRDAGVSASEPDPEPEVAPEAEPADEG